VHETPAVSSAVLESRESVSQRKLCDLLRRDTSISETTDPLSRIRETKDEAEALRLALQEIRDIVWTPKIAMPTLSKRIAQVLLAVHNRDRSKA